jgi:hypothetical protein
MTDLATLLEAIAALVAAVLWPGVALAAILLFRRELSAILGRVRRASIMGQEVELDELNRSADAAEQEVAALPASSRDEQNTLAEEDAVRRILNEAARAPKAALLLLASEIEKEVRDLIAALGLAGGGRYVPLREAIQMLQEWGGLPAHVPSSVAMFLDVRNRLVHGRDASDDDVLRAIDSGVTILRALQAVPRETHVVYHPGVQLYADPEGQQVSNKGMGVVLETESPGGATKTLRVYPTTRTHFQKGKRVAWEWNLDRVFEESWYRNPDTGHVEYGWSQSAEFVGRHLEDLQLPQP